jgi:hypothetical protein
MMSGIERLIDIGVDPQLVQQLQTNFDELVNFMIDSKCSIFPQKEDMKNAIEHNIIQLTQHFENAKEEICCQNRKDLKNASFKLRLTCLNQAYVLCVQPGVIWLNSFVHHNFHCQKLLQILTGLSIVKQIQNMMSISIL